MEEAKLKVLERTKQYLEDHPEASMTMVISIVLHQSKEELDVLSESLEDLMDLGERSYQLTKNRSRYKQ